MSAARNTGSTPLSLARCRVLERKLERAFDAVEDFIAACRRRVRQSANLRRKSRDAGCSGWLALIREAIGERQVTCEERLAAAIARALLVAEKGSKFERAIRLMTDEYRIAAENVQHYSQPRLEESHREDVLVRFRQQMEFARQRLRTLDVHIVKPEVGKPVEPVRHRVVRQRVTDSDQLVDCIAEVVAPGFSWVDDQGNQRVICAEVVAYSAAQKGRDGAVAEGSAAETLFPPCAIDGCESPVQAPHEVSP